MSEPAGQPASEITGAAAPQRTTCRSRVRRAASAAIALLSLLSCLTVVGLWARSYAHWEEIAVGTNAWDVSATAWRGRAQLELITWHEPSGSVQPSRDNVIVKVAEFRGLVVVYVRRPADPGADFDDPRYPPVWRIGRFSYAHDDWSGIWHSRAFRFPMWLPALLFALLPARWLWRGRELRTRRARGLCRQCGYDLRASPGRCPECGSAAVSAG